MKEEPDISRRDEVIMAIRRTGFMLGMSITLLFLTFYIASYVYMGVGGTLGVSLGQTAFASLLLGIVFTCMVVSMVMTYHRYYDMMAAVHALLDDYEEMKEQLEAQ